VTEPRPLLTKLTTDKLRFWTFMSMVSLAPVCGLLTGGRGFDAAPLPAPPVEVGYPAR
jgi:hypothetical protein